MGKSGRLQAAPRCQGYLIVDTGSEGVRADQLALALQRRPVASVLLRGRHDNPELLRPWIAACQSANAAGLVEGDADLAVAVGADGLHLPYPGDLATAEQGYRQARAILGTGRIVGASAGLIRHDAMVLAELGADYIAFEGADGGDLTPLLELVAWWAELFEVPCVAWNAGSLKAAGQFAEAGADFVAAGSLDILSAIAEPQGAGV